MGGFEKVALKKAADYAALEFRKTITVTGGGTHIHSKYYNKCVRTKMILSDDTKSRREREYG